MSKKQKNETSAKAPVKLTRAEKKEIQAVIRKYKGDGKPHSAQASIPYEAMYQDGVCRVTPRTFSKCIEFTDISYQLAQADTKEGLWFSLPTTTEKLQAALREIGISADNPQDFFLYDYRSPQARPIKLPRDMVLSAGMDELNFLAARLEKLDATELTELNAALTSPQSDFHNIGQIIDYPENVDFYVHLPDVTGTGQLGDYYLNRSGMVDMPEEWKAGILLPRFGLHIANTEQGVFTDYGYLVKSGDEWQRVHEGQLVPEEYRVMAYPAPEILREESKVQPEAAAPTKVPQPVTPILLNGQNSAERMKEITDRLETGIQELFESERYKAYLTTMSKFHSYSFNNTLLIAMQGGQLPPVQRLVSGGGPDCCPFGMPDLTAFEIQYPPFHRNSHRKKRTAFHRSCPGSRCSPAPFSALT